MSPPTLTALKCLACKSTVWKGPLDWTARCRREGELTRQADHHFAEAKGLHGCHDVPGALRHHGGGTCQESEQKRQESWRLQGRSKEKRLRGGGEATRTEVVACAQDDDDGILSPHSTANIFQAQHISHHHLRWPKLWGQPTWVPDQHCDLVPWEERGGGERGQMTAVRGPRGAEADRQPKVSTFPAWGRDSVGGGNLADSGNSFHKT